jgi:hypothetical protein
MTVGTDAKEFEAVAHIPVAGLRELDAFVVNRTIMEWLDLFAGATNDVVMVMIV